MPTNPIKIIECPRDAWQGLRGEIPTGQKVAFLRSLIAAGFKHIDAVSFVSPRAVPQMADSEEVLKALNPPGDIEIIGIVVNEKGADRAIATKAVTTLGFPYSISESFLHKNQNQSAEENYDMLEAIASKADGASLGVVAYVSMAFGNPYGDHWDLDEVLQAIENITNLGIQSVSLADTVGVASPALIAEVVAAAIDKYMGYDIGVHLHARAQDAVALVLAAYDAGCRRFDSALGGLGGCPFAQDTMVGNIATESVLEALKERSAELPPLRDLAGPIAVAEELALQYR